MAESMSFKLTGIVPLLMHDKKLADPLNPYAKANKILTSKRKKTDEDQIEIMRLEWEAGLYLNEGIVALPERVVKGSLYNAAKQSKLGKQLKMGLIIVDNWMPLSYKGPTIKVTESKEIPNHELDKFFEPHHHNDMVRVRGNMVPRCRPIFFDWSLVLNISIDTAVFDRRTIVQIIDYAGKYVGFCEKRPELGRFESVEV